VEATRQLYQLEIKNRVAILEGCEEGDDSDRSGERVEKEWEKWRDAIMGAGEKVLGFKRGGRKEAWISTETWQAIDARRQLKQELEQARASGLGHQETSMEYKAQDKEVKKIEMQTG
jgi:hypothetical protein